MKKNSYTPKVTVFQSELFKTNSTVIQTDDCVILIDPTWLPSEVEAIQRFVYSIKKEKPLYLIFTHSDYDHILGYGAFPDAITIGSINMVDRHDEAEILEQIIQFDHDYYLDRTYDITYPSLQHVVKKDGQDLKLGKTHITFYHAKGHTNDGIMTVIEPEGVLVLGDYCSDVEFPFIYSSSIDYEITLNKLDKIIEKHALSLFIPGHGTPTLLTNELIMRRDQSLCYIQELRDCIQRKEIDSTYSILEKYRYPKSLKQSQQHNIDLVRKELNEK